MIPMRAGRLALAFLVVVALIAAIDIAARAISGGTGIATGAIDASITALCFLAYPWISPAVLEAVAKTPKKSAKQAPPSPASGLRLDLGLDLQPEPELELERNFEQLTVTAQRLANEAGIRAPRLVMVDDPGHIAFGVGMPSRSTIFITKGLSNHVTASTLEGILAHEIGHISSRHTLVQAFVFAGLFAGKTLIGIPGGLAPMILLGYLAVLRQCEFAADRCAVSLVGSERAAATLLELRELVREQVKTPNAAPDFASWLKDGFSTHPSFARRIAAVRAG
jgi:Zn-dependent protease with chaperone function